MMQDETRGICEPVERGCNCGGGSIGRIFNNCCCDDSEILFFIIIFLLLFTSFGNCGRRY